MPTPMARDETAPEDEVEALTAFAEMLAAARAGEPQGCAGLWHTFAPAVASYARAKGSADPDGLTSDVFLAVFGQLSRFEGDESGFRGLIFTIAHRRLVDELRARARRGTSVPWSEYGDRRSVPSAEDSAAEAEGTTEVRRLLGRLSADQRDVLELRILSDLTVDQTAAVLGKRVGAVKALQRRGLEALRRNLAAGRTLSGADGDGER